MTIGLLIVTHNNIGADLVDTATAMLGVCPLATEILPVSQKSDPEALLSKARQLVAMLDQGNGVLVLTDIYGSTPSNIAHSLIQQERVKVIAGINLPMLIRVLNYPRLSLSELAEKALSGGRDGILCYTPQPEA
ncbi:MAG TPA: PTS fructose transporter subunit IIA [Gammaproteobacteria bacterium]|nr:PTS fructose transporter subunit IIA [Gammaproteobacteria bacterium]